MHINTKNNRYAEAHIYLKKKKQFYKTSFKQQYEYNCEENHF